MENEEIQDELTPELEQPETPAAPATPAFVMPDDVKESLLAEAENRAYNRLRAEQQQMQPQAPAVQPQAPQDPYQQAVQEAEANGIFDDRWINARALTITRQQLKQEMQAEFQQSYGSQIDRYRAKDAVQTVAGDLNSAAQEYLKPYAQYIDPSWDPNNPLMRVFRDAAENVHNKTRDTTFRPETTRQEPAARVNEGDFADYNRERAQFGLEPLSRNEYAELSGGR